ncbi:MAG TPA: SPOR domain-containing protein [Steroidobacteraceae bacterium]|nr:SPOR domain-containing protein [Steroidobacteraceae bacterium]
MSARALVTVFAVSLLSLSGCSREKSDWKSAQAADTAESYQQFVDEHPESTLVTNARERLAQLAEEKDWRAAAEADTRDAYEKFLAQYPQGKWAKEAGERVANFGAAPAAAGSATPESANAAPAGATPGATPAGDAAAVPDAGPPPLAGEFGVQLGAFSSTERANEEWKKLSAGTGGLLDGLSPRVVVGDSGGKTIYRLQAQVRDEAQARAVCGGLKAAKKPCVPVVPKK